MATNSYGWMSNSKPQQNQQDLFSANRNMAAAQGKQQQQSQWQGGPGIGASELQRQSTAANAAFQQQMSGWQNRANQGGGNWQDYARQDQQAQYGGGQGIIGQGARNPSANYGRGAYTGPGWQGAEGQQGGRQPSQGGSRFGAGMQPGGQVGVAGGPQWNQPQYNQPQYGGGSFNAPTPPSYSPQPSYGGSRQYTPSSVNSNWGGDVGSPPQQPGQQVGYTPTPNTALNNLQQTWQGGKLGDIGWLGNKDNRMIAEDYANYYGIPLSNLLLQQQAQTSQEGQFAATLAEQSKVNQQQYGLQQAGSQREDKALDFGMFTNQRDFDQAKSQFETTTGLSYAQLAAQVGTANADREMQKYSADVQSNTSRYNADVQANVARYGIDADAATAAQRLGLDYATLSQQDKQYMKTLALNQQTQDQTFQIQSGQLGVQQGAEQRLQRGQSLDEAFRRQQLQQEAELMRENYQNQLMQSRYSAFGRAQAPQTRLMGAWR